MGFTLPPPANPMEQARALITRKENIEAEIEAQISVLKANSSTLQSPLVDQDGFPRADIDIYAVRGARVRIIELRNDLEATMNAIGKALEGIYDPSLRVVEGDDTNLRSGDDSNPCPFAKLNGVAPGRPAAEAVRMQQSQGLMFPVHDDVVGPATRRSSRELWSSGPSVIPLDFFATFGRSSCIERECVLSSPCYLLH